MAGAGYKLFNTGDVLTAAQVNTYLQEQAVMRFATTAARTTALTGVLSEGMVTYIDATDSLEFYNGSAWIAVNTTAGDITGVTAGTGLSGGGTSGDVTLSLSTPVSATNGGTAQTTYATGDLLYASASNTLTKRAIGTTGQVLTVSGGVPTWATPASGSTFAGCFLYNNANTTVGNNSYTTLNFNSELYDTDNYHSTTTNTSRITIPSGKAGYYVIRAQVQFDSTSTTGTRATGIVVNGAGLSAFFSAPSPATAQTVAYTQQRYLAVGDYVEMNAYHTQGGTLTLIRDQDNSFLAVAYLGA